MACAAWAAQTGLPVGESFVVKHTFIEFAEVDSLAAPLRRRSLSDPALCKHILDEEVAPVSDSSGAETASVMSGKEAFGMGDLSDLDTDGNASFSSLQQHSDSAHSQHNTGDEPASPTGESIGTSWTCEHLVASGNDESAVADGCHMTDVNTPSELAELLREHARLALENQLLKSKARMTAEKKNSEAGVSLAGPPSSAHAQPRAKPAMPPGIWFVPFVVETSSGSPSQQRCGGQGQLVQQASNLRSSQHHCRRRPVEAAAASQNLPPAEGDDRTTVMLRNLPNNYSRDMVAALLDGEGFAGLYDFLYLPMDFKTQACLGYAFVNLVAPGTLRRFWKAFTGYSKWAFPSKKVCCVTWSGPQQGRDAQIERYRNSPVMHPSVPEDYKPLVLEGGQPVPFPAPSKTIKAPRSMNCSRCRDA